MANVRAYQVTFLGGCLDGTSHESTDDQVSHEVAIGSGTPGEWHHYRRRHSPEWDVTYVFHRSTKEMVAIGSGT